MCPDRSYSLVGVMVRVGAVTIVAGAVVISLSCTWSQKWTYRLARRRTTKRGYAYLGVGPRAIVGVITAAGVGHSEVKCW